MVHHVCVEIIIMLLVSWKGNFQKGKVSILSFGFNQVGDVDGNVPGIHAEHAAINKLKPSYKKKRLQTINLLVIRISKNNKLQSSKPCTICIQNMKTLPEKKSYKIKNIYYSNNDGDIVKSNFQILEKEEQHLSRFYRRKKYNN